METEKSWKTLDSLPAHDGSGWAIWEKKQVSYVDLSEITTLIDKWLPPNPILIGEPGTYRFFPPICIAILQKTIFRTIRRNMTNHIIAFASLAAIFSVLALFDRSTNNLSFAITMLLISLMLAFDYFGSLRSEKGIFERAMFFYWLRTASSVRTGVVLCVCFVIAMGCTQLLLQMKMGGIDALFHTSGMMYEQVRDGEIWRILTGPYFHYSIFHFLVNSVLLLFIGTITWSVLGKVSVITFIIGNIAGSYLQMTFGGDLFNNFGGISGGVYALFGFLIVFSIIDKNVLPKGFPLLLFNVAIIGIFGSEITSINAATTAHIGGLIVGMTYAVIYFLKKRNV